MKKFKILLLSGGGIKGIAIIASLLKLEEEGLLKSIEKIVGTSIGSFIGLLLSLGYSTYAVKLLMIKLKFNELQTYNLNNFLTNFGFDDGHRFIKLINSIFKYKNINPNITFKEFHKISKYHLTMIGTNVNLSKGVRFNVDNFPDMKVVDALRISTGYPLIFTPIKIDDCLYSDGAIVCPVECENLTNKEIKESLAIVIHKGYSRYKTDTFDQYLSSIISCLLDALTENLLAKLKYKITLSVPIFSMNLNLTDNQKEEIVKIGEDEATNFINKIKSKKEKRK